MFLCVLQCYDMVCFYQYFFHCSSDPSNKATVPIWQEIVATLERWPFGEREK